MTMIVNIIMYITVLLLVLLEICTGAYYEHEVSSISSSSSSSSTSDTNNHHELPPPYSLGWYFDDPNLDSLTCQTEINMIRSILYETYYNISIQDSNMTMILAEKLANPMIESEPVTMMTESLLSTTSRLRKSRQLSTIQQHNEKESSSSVTCTPICTNRPNLWLIYDGCDKKCNNDDYHYNDNDLSDVQKIMLQRYRERHNHHKKQGHIGEVTKILYGQGAITASTFYTTVRQLIPKFDECRNILLTMKYQRIPLVFNPSQ